MPLPSCAPLLALLALTACASTEIAHTPGEIPRDGTGKPVWALIEPPAPAATR